MQWYIDYFRSEDLRIVDPEGYALGMTVGFILIPLVVIGALIMIGVLIYERRHGRGTETMYPTETINNTADEKDTTTT
jgi:hypothetical protein